MGEIVGHGGGKGGGGGGVNNDPDTLRSIAYATVVDLWGAGEIEGLVNGAQSMFFDGTPLQNPDGSFNFSNVQWDFRNGTQGQTPISGISGANDVETEVAVNAEFRNDTPVVRTITDPNTDAARVKILLPALQYTDSNGVHGTSVTYAIDVQSNGGGFVQVLYQTLNGKSSGQYERSFVFDLPGSAPWDIRVRRVTPDNHSSILQNQTYWSSYTAIQRVLLSYPNCAYLALRIDASQFPSIPTRGYVVKGWRVQVPSNYDPVARTYTGLWDGTFQIAWTDNPAWNYWFLLQRVRDGLGQFLTPETLALTKWDLYTIAQYCDQLVSDGKGGQEPRFTCAIYMAQKEDAYTALNNLASCFRGMIYWGAGSVALTQDAPAVSEPSQIFTNASVIGGRFQYAGSDRRTRHTVVLVSWIDPSNNFRTRTEYVPDNDGIAKYGIIDIAVTAVGCKSQGQAIRFGRWLLESEKLGEQVNFSTGMEGAKAKPGDVIEIANRARAGKRIGGRLLGATASQVTLDSAVDLQAGVGYTLYAQLPDGTVGQTSVSTAAGTGLTVLQLSPPLSAIPCRAAVWMLKSDLLQPEKFLVRSVVEQRGKPSDGGNSLTYQYVALQYNETKFGTIDNSTSLVPPSISTLITGMPAAPQNVHALEAISAIGATRASQLNIGCDAVPNVSGYSLTFRVDSDPPQTVVMTSNSYTIFPAKLGTWSIDLRSIGANGKRSVPTSIVAVVDGISDPPPDLTGFSGTILSSSQLQLSWLPSTDISVVTGGNIEIRFNSATSGATWASSSQIGLAAGSSTQATVPLSTGTYLAKPVTFDGIESADPVYLTYGSSGGGGALTASATPSGVYKSGVGASVTSQTIMVSVSGGTPPYTHSWAHSSGDAAISADSPSSNNTIFTATGMADGTTLSAVWIDSIQDSATTPNVTSVTVNVTLNRSSGGGGGGGSGGVIR